MAVKPRLTKQMPWVGTPTQRKLVDAVAEQRNVSKAEVMREALDYYYGLVDGEIPRGQQLQDCIEVGLDRLS